MSAEALTRDFLRYVCQTSPAPLGIVVERAHGSSLWDTAGREYLDLLSGMGVADVGHSPAAVLAGRRRTGRAPSCTWRCTARRCRAPQVLLARRLAELAPGDLDVTYFTNSGTEAIEGAVKLVRKHTRRSRLVAFRGGYHGDTLGALLAVRQCHLSTSLRTAAGCGRVPALRQRRRPRPHRCGRRRRRGRAHPGRGRRPACRWTTSCPRSVGVAMRWASLLVCDEVMTGLGRTGGWFACQHWEVCPTCPCSPRRWAAGCRSALRLAPGDHADALARSAAGARHHLRRSPAVLRGRPRRARAGRARVPPGACRPGRRGVARAPPRPRRSGAPRSARPRSADRAGIQLAGGDAGLLVRLPSRAG